MFNFVIFSLIITTIVAFVPSINKARSFSIKDSAASPSTKDNSDHPYAHLMDDKGRVPGDAGYIPIERKAPANFAEYQAELKAAKAKKEAEAAGK